MVRAKSLSSPERIQNEGCKVHQSTIEDAAGDASKPRERIAGYCASLVDSEKLEDVAE